MNLKIVVLVFLGLYSCDDKTSVEMLNKANKVAERNIFDAIAICDTIINDDSNYAPAYAKRGEFRGLCRDYDAALIDLNTAIKIDTSNSGYLVRRGSIKGYLNDIPGAVNDYSKAIQIDSNYLAFNNLGVIEMNANEFVRAMNFFNSSIKRNDTASVSYHNRGNLKEKMGNSNEAILDFNKAIQIDPYIDIYYYDKAIANYTLKDYVGSINNLSRAIEIQPNISMYYYVRGYIYDELDSTERCCEDLRKAILLGNIDAKKKFDEVCKE